MLLFNFHLEDDTIVRKNFILNLFDGAVFTFGMSFVSVITILPIYLKEIGGNNISIGLIPVVWTLGFNLPQIFVANYTANQPYKKKIMMVTALFQRLPWMLLAIISLFSFAQNEHIGILLFFIAFGLAAIGGGVNLPAWFDLFAKLTPVKMRGKQFAFRTALGSLLGITAGWLSIEILENIEFPNNFSILFFIAFAIMMSSYLLLMQLVEDVPNPPRKQLRITEFIQKLPSILKYEINYRNFLIADILIIIAILSNAFIAVYAIDKFSLPESYAGTFTIIVMVSMMLGSFIFGIIADKIGHRFNFLIAAVFTLIACIIAIWSESVYIYYAVFFFSSCVTGILHVSRLPLISEICSENDRPTFVSLSNLVTIPFVLFGVFAGWFAETWGYDSVFILTGTFAFIASIWIIVSLKEPRVINCENK